MLTGRAMLSAKKASQKEWRRATSLTVAPFRNTPLAQCVAVFHDLNERRSSLRVEGPIVGAGGSLCDVTRANEAESTVHQCQITVSALSRFESAGSIAFGPIIAGYCWPQ